MKVSRRVAAAAVVAGAAVASVPVVMVGRTTVVDTQVRAVESGLMMRITLPRGTEFASLAWDDADPRRLLLLGVPVIGGLQDATVGVAPAGNRQIVWLIEKAPSWTITFRDKAGEVREYRNGD